MFTKEFGKINIIIVTGDFHNFCEKEKFILAKEFLARLTEQLELDINKDLFIVPGNHDGVTKVDCKNTHIKALNDNPIDDEAPESFQALEGAFQDYEKFVKIAQQYGKDAENISSSAGTLSEMTDGIERIMGEVSLAIQNIAESAQKTADNSAKIMESVGDVAKIVDNVSVMSEGQEKIADNLNSVVGQYRL